jgi:PKD repeat protein
MRNKIIIFTLLILLLSLMAAKPADAFTATLDVSPREGYSPLTIQYNCYTFGGFGWSTYAISFGDGSTSTNRQGSKTYTKPGDYEIRCVATDQLHFMAEDSKNVLVKEVPPPTSFERIDLNVNPTSGDSPLTVQYSCDAYGGMEPVSYAISFGDGSTSTNKQGSKTYTKDGSYNLRCVATDALHFMIEASEKITVTKPQEPTPFTGIDLNVNPKEGFAPLTIQYSCQAYGGMEPVSYAISFGDGSTSTNKQGSKTYTKPGDYKVTCTATDALHFQISKTETVRVKEDKLLLVSLEVSPQEGYAPLEVSYECQASGNAPFSYKISFGDGTVSYSNKGTKTYYEPGSYTVSCEAKDAKGATKTASKNVLVKEKTPLYGISFDMNPRTGTAPLTTSYQCTVQGGAGPVSYHINFGDGTSSQYNTGTKTYNNEGSYTAVCTAKDALGQELKASVPITVTKAHEGRPFERLDLHVNPQEGQAPLTVQYSCSAVGGYLPVSYAISFGDGTTSTQREGTKTYNNEGSYNIRCVATDALHNQISATKTVYVNPHVTPLRAELSVSPSQGQAPLQVSFSCSASGGKEPYAYSVSMGDGTVINSRQGTHTYHNPGEYTARCIVLDASGQAAPASVIVMVDERIEELRAQLDVHPTEGHAPLEISYSCSASGGKEPYSYSINFGDGTGSNDPQGTHTYHTPGEYTVRCIVMDYSGQAASVSSHVRVDEKKDFTGIELNIYPESGFAPLEVQYWCYASGGNYPIEYTVTFGDGTSSNEKDGSKTYHEPGDYTIRCTARDAKSNEISAERKVSVNQKVPALQAELSVSPTQGHAPLQISYSCSAVGGMEPYSYTISFGDGTVSNSPHGTHTYQNEGTYKVICTVTDYSTQSASREIEVIVLPIAKELEAHLNVYPTEGFAPLLVSYTCSASGGVEPYTYAVSFGDGTANGREGTKLYTAPGIYHITCNVRDARGVQASDTKIVSVRADLPLQVDFQITPQTGYAPLEVSYQCIASGNSPFTYHITFNDGETTTTPEGTKTYHSPGTYEARCTVTDSYGRQQSASRIITVKEDKDFKSISFNIDPSYGDAPLHVAYYCSVEGGNAPISYHIEFGDGVASHSPQGEHTYHSPGTYNARCTATDARGKTISQEKTVTVKEPYIDVDFTSISFDVNPQSGEAPLHVTYSCFVEGGNDPITMRVSVDGSEIREAQGRQIEGSHTFDVPGVYVMRCTAQDRDSDTIMAQKTVTVMDDRDWHIWAYPREGPAPLTVTFHANTTQFEIREPIRWDFQTGHIAFGQSVVHTFTRAGVYVVEASFVDEFGVRREQHIDIIVTPPEEKEPFHQDGIRITGFVAEVYGGRIYVTANVVSESRQSLNDLKVQLMVPDHFIHETRTIRRLDPFERTSVSFIIPVDGGRVDTFVILSVTANDIYKREIRPLIG